MIDLLEYKAVLSVQAGTVSGNFIHLQHMIDSEVFA